MSYKPYYSKGDWLAICDSCGRKYKASILRKRWDNLMVCPDDWEPRQPQDFVRGVVDTQIAPWMRDEPADVFLADTTRAAIADVAIADSAIADNVQWAGTVPPSTFYNNGVP